MVTCVLATAVFLQKGLHRLQKHDPRMRIQMDVNYVRIQIIDLYPPKCRRRPSCKASAGSKSCLNVSLSQGRSPLETQIFLFLVYNHFKELSKIPSLFFQAWNEVFGQPYG